MAATALSIYLPEWAVWLARRRRTSSKPNVGGSNRPEDTAWVLWTSQRGVQQVVHVCKRAEAAGVRPGMTLAQARSLCIGLVVRDVAATPDEDAAALRRLARWMLRYAPTVSTDEPDGLLVDIAGCERLFGGHREQLRQIEQSFAGWGSEARWAVAPTFGCAWAVARYASSAASWVDSSRIDEVVNALPVAALRIDEKTEDALFDVGVESIGQVRKLPRDQLAARFGRELLLRLDQMLGAAAETIEPIRLPRRFQALYDFDGHITEPEIIAHTTRELLSRLVKQLKEVQRGISELHVELRRLHCEPVLLSIRLTYPSDDPAHLWKMLVSRLERANLGYGVTEIELRAVRTDRLRSSQAAFLRDTAETNTTTSAALGELVDHLVDRLGAGVVTRVQTSASYLPEQAFCHSPVVEVVTAKALRSEPSGDSINLAQRPSQLFETPEPIRILSLVPEGPPIWLEWRSQAGRVVTGIGPERILPPWWSGGNDAARDYYAVEDEVGRRLWVYREGMSGTWYVHGQWS